MFKRLTARRIHLWIAIAMALPLLLMAGSGVLIALRSVTTIQVPMAWMGAESLPERLPIMAYLEGADGSIWIGNAQGLNRVHPAQVETIADFSGQEVVGLARLPDADLPVVATRMALWVRQDEGWSAVRRGRVRQLTNLPDGRVLAIVGGRGELADSKPLVSSDGRQWQPYGRALQAGKALPALTEPKVALHQFMRELHSGAFFLGKGPGEITWSSLSGGVLALLSLTGVWMWLRVERQKARERRLTAATTTGGLAAQEH